MKVYSFARKQYLNRPRREVFDFFERPENLSRLTPPDMKFQVLTPEPITMAAGTIIDYSVTVFGIKRHWRTLICSYHPPEEFVDVQLKGPYLMWHHTHKFVEVANGTEIVDEVSYVMPFGYLGRVVQKWLVRPRLKNIFDFRAKVIADYFK